MQIQFTARHCEPTAELRSLAEQRLERVERLVQDIHGARVVISLERHLHVAEITLRLNHHDVVVKEEHPDARTAVEQAAARVEEHVRRFKEKRVERRRVEGRGNGGADEPASGDAAPEED